jgi:hypothetical protein
MLSRIGVNNSGDSLSLVKNKLCVIWEIGHVWHNVPLYEVTILVFGT